MTDNLAGTFGVTKNWEISSEMFSIPKKHFSVLTGLNIFAALNKTKKYNIGHKSNLQD